MNPTVMIELSHCAIRSSRLFRMASQAVYSIPEATDWYEASTGDPCASFT